MTTALVNSFPTSAAVDVELPEAVFVRPRMLSMDVRSVSQLFLAVLEARMALQMRSLLRRSGAVNLQQVRDEVRLVWTVGERWL
jgi:hypothetical protein